MLRHGRRTFGRLILTLVIGVTLTFWLLSQPRLILLPQGINNVPACEDPADIAAFSLTPCPEPLPSVST